MAGGGKGGGGDQVVGYRYYFGIHMVVGRGPIDGLSEIVVGEKTAWRGEQTTDGTIQINRPGLFGGDEKEGGIKGPFVVMMGSATQVVNAGLAQMLKGDVPAFRGIAGFYYNGLICANNPYPKAWKFRVRRALEGWADDTAWYPETAVISIPDTESPEQIIRAMNPSHILYECCTNPEWGRGLPTTLIDAASFTHAANVLFAEKFGLCLRWVRSDRLSEFIGSVANHIGAALYISRSTGLVTLKLLRFDYDPNDLPLFSYTSGLLEITGDESGAASEANNEIVVKYRRVAKDEERMVRVHNLASFQANGSVISITLDFPGLPTHALATRVAQRELRVRTANLKRFKLRLDRRAWQLEPGSPFRISDPTRGIGSMVVRVGRIEQSDPKTNEYTVSAVEDVFGMPSTVMVEPQVSLWRPPDTVPRAALNVIFEEPSYRDLARALNPVDLAAVPPDSTSVVVVARRPSDLTQDFQLWTRTATEELYFHRGTGSFAPFATLAGAIDEYQTTISIDLAEDLDLITQLGAVRLGNEIVRLVALDEDARTAVIARGCVDSVPLPHPAGQGMFFTDGFEVTDGREYVTGEEVHGKLLTRTLADVLPFDTAVDYVRVVSNRHFRPYPPADLRVNGAPYASAPNVFGTDAVFTWVARNRLIQLDALVSHTEAGIVAETGTTYNVRVKSGTTLLRETTAITAETYTYSQANWLADGGVNDLTFELESERGAEVSWKMYVFHLRFDDPQAGAGASMAATGDRASQSFLRRLFGGAR